MGLRFYHLAWGVGRKKTAGDDRQRTPRRKIRSRFYKYKHTSLIFLLGESSGLRFSLAQITILVTQFVTLWRR